MQYNEANLIWWQKIRFAGWTEINDKLETKASSHQGQCIQAGSSVSPPRLVLLTMSIINMLGISRKLCVRLFTLCKISTRIFRILWRHLQTDLRSVYSVTKNIWSCNRWHKECPNRCIKLAMLSFLKLVRNWPKNAVINLAFCCGAIWRHREKQQYRCTTTIHPVYNCSKKILENLLPVGLLVRTNLYIPSRFWTTDAKFDTCCQRYVATCGKKII